MPRSGVTRYTPEKVRSHCSGTRTGPGVREVDAAVRLDHHVIGPIEPPSLEAVGDHGDAAVEFLPGDPSAVMLAGEQPALEVAGQPIGAVRRLLDQGHALARHVLHPPVVMNVTEQQIAAFLPPHWSFGGPLGAAEAIGQHLDRLGQGDDLFQLRSELLDPLAAWADAPLTPPATARLPTATAIPNTCRREMPF